MDQFALRIEQASQRCKDCSFDIPDAIKIRQFFVSSEMPADKRAMVLMSAGSVNN